MSSTVNGGTHDFTRFPKGFLIGTASSSYQVEGAWNLDGKSETIWDRFVHEKPEKIYNGDTGDIACDSYHKYKIDVELMKEIGFDFYRFSISWARVLPTGEENNVNQAGIDYYNNLINEILSKGLIPIVTLYHWELPQDLQDIGGWANPLIVQYFKAFADTCFKHFGDRVKNWITINEPLIMSISYGSNLLAPALQLSGSKKYLTGHHSLLAHSAAYHLYDKHYRNSQNGKIGITLVGEFRTPASSSLEDISATDIAFEFTLGWFANPIFGKDGDYPPIMRKLIDAQSAAENRSISKLPCFTQEEIKLLKGSSDFFGLNHYSTMVARTLKPGETNFGLFASEDHNVTVHGNPSWENTSIEFFQVTPFGFRGMFKWISDKYDNPPVFVFENGYAGFDTLEDDDRIKFHHEYFTEMLNAIYIDKCNVIGYTVWSFLDSFEWISGYRPKFGIIKVDFTDPERKRTPKKSAGYFKKILATRSLVPVSVNAVI